MKELVDWGRSICENLGTIGPVNIQGKIHEGVIKFFEINPRFSGGIPLTVKSGPDFPELLIRMNSGQKIEPIIGDYNKDLVMICYEDGLFIEGKNLGNIDKIGYSTPEDYDIFQS